MNDAVAAMIRDVSAFEQQIEDTLAEVVKAREDELLDLNRDDQLFDAGTTGTGLPVRPSYADVTVQYKKRKGQPYDRVTLRDKGNFHRSFRVTYRSGKFEIDATDRKTAKLVKKYGKEIFGLTGKSLGEFVLIIKPDVVIRARRKILNE